MSEDRELVRDELRSRQSWSVSEFIYHLAVKCNLSPATIRRVLIQEYDAGNIKRNDDLELYWAGP